MKKTASLLVVMMLLFSFVTPTFASNHVISADVEKGLVRVKLAQLSATKNIILIEKSGVKYTYPVTSVDTIQLPLQLGNGEYTVKIMENISGNRYKELEKNTIVINMDNQTDVFLNSIQDINWEDSKVIQAKAYELTRSLKEDELKIKAIYKFVLDSFQYDYSKAKTVTSGYFPNVDTLMTRKMGICYDYAAVFAAMTRSVGIPTKLVKGYSVATGEVYHAWNEVYVKGVWKTIDTTIDDTSGKQSIIYKTSSDYKGQKIY